MPEDYKAPLPRPTPESKPFWDGCKHHELRLQRCRDCGDAYFYPRNVCPACLSANVEWFRASGHGKVHTFTVVHAGGRNPPLELPFVLAVIELDEGVRVMSNLVGVPADPEQIRLDMPVVVEFADVTEQFTLPRFRPA
jgi:uncharacterized OB-fold protein